MKERLLTADEHIWGEFTLGDEIERYPPDPQSGARHRAEILVKSNMLRLVLVTMLPGGELHEHSAPGPITIQVLKGAVRFSVEGEPREMRAGQLVSLGPGVRHAVECIEEGAFLLTIGTMTRPPDPGGDEA